MDVVALSRVSIASNKDSHKITICYLHFFKACRPGLGNVFHLCTLKKFHNKDDIIIIIIYVDLKSTTHASQHSVQCKN